MPSSSTPSCLDLDIFRTIEQQVLSERTTKSSQQQQQQQQQPCTLTCNQLTRESHPHLQVNHRHNIVSYLTSRKRRTHSDLSIQSCQPVHRLYGIGYFEIKVLCVKAKKQESPFRFGASTTMTSTTTTSRTTGRPGVISVGFAQENYSNTSQPGWKQISYGYHSDDGMKFHNSGSPLGPICAPNSTVAETFGAGDVVGCGFNFEKKEIFYTKNGKWLGVAFRNADTRACYATVGLDKASVQVFFNEDQFMFGSKLRAMREEARQVMIQDMIESCDSTTCNDGIDHDDDDIDVSISSRPYSSIESELLKNSGTQLIDHGSGGLSTLCHQLIRQYLVHEGYLDTVIALDNQTKVMTTGGSSMVVAEATTKTTSMTTNGQDKELESLRLRSKIRSLIMNGETMLALELYSQYSQQQQQQQQQVVEQDDTNNHEQIMYLMHSQIFIELVGRGQVLEAAEYARQNLSLYIEREGQIFSPLSLSTSTLLSISEVLGLLAYINPIESPLGHLLSREHVQRMATLVNELLVQQYEGKVNQSNLVLKRIVSHTGALYKEVIQT